MTDDARHANLDDFYAIGFDIDHRKASPPPRVKQKTCKDPSHLEAAKTLREINKTVGDGIYLLSQAQLLLLDALLILKGRGEVDLEAWETRVKELLGPELSKDV
jgi:hypothetical protein